MTSPAPRLPLALASPLVLLLACGIDLISRPQRLSALAIGALVALCIGVGTLHGWLWDTAYRLLARAPRVVATLFWSAIAVALAGWLIVELGAVSRLGTAYNTLALLILAAGALGAPILAAAAIALQPSERHPLGLLPSTRLAVRITGGLALATGAACCFLGDRRLFVGLYPDAHLALRVGFLWFAGFALVVLVPVRVKAQRRVWLLALLIGALGIVIGENAAGDVLALTLRPWPRLVVESARRLTDVDFDGYSNLLMGGDCAPLNRSVNPTAPEIPGNGIDDNCLLGDAKAVDRAAQHLHVPGKPSPIDVVLITVDSLREDKVGAYCKECRKKGLALTPNIDAFASGGLVFDRAYTPGGWTSIAVSSFMRGVYPRRIDWTRVYETNAFRLVRWGQRARLPANESLVKMFPLPISDRHANIADWLAQRGMRTIAVVDDGFSELLSLDSKIAPGFEIYREVDELPVQERGDSGTAQLALEEMARVPGDQRFFMWVHFFGPHSPNSVHGGVRIDGDSLMQGYEHEIRYADSQVGKLLRAIEGRGEPTAVIVSADHGEEFVEGGRHHGFSLKEEIVHVPLIARVPGWPTGRSAVPVSLVDLMPTLCALTGTPAPSGIDGRSWSDLLAAKSALPTRVLLSDTWQYDRLGRLIRGVSAAIDGDIKVQYEPLYGVGWSLTRHPELPTAVSEPIAPDSPLPAVRALSAYLESATGPLHMSY